MAASDARERTVLEDALRSVSRQAIKANDLIDEILAAGLGGSDPMTVHAKMLRLELLNVKADLERERGRFVLDCSRCGQTMHWISGLGARPGHWAHREPETA